MCVCVRDLLAHRTSPRSSLTVELQVRLQIKTLQTDRFRSENIYLICSCFVEKCNTVTSLRVPCSDWLWLSPVCVCSRDLWRAAGCGGKWSDILTRLGWPSAPHRPLHLTRGSRGWSRCWSSSLLRDRRVREEERMRRSEVKTVCKLTYYWWNDWLTSRLIAQLQTCHHIIYNLHDTQSQCFQLVPTRTGLNHVESIKTYWTFLRSNQKETN